MPSTLVHAGLALVLVAALLDRVDRRALAAVLVVVALPEADALAGLWLDGAHRALFHTLLFPLTVAGLLCWDTRYRGPDGSWLRRRVGDRGVRVAWVVCFASLFAHVLLDYAHLEGINVLYPVVDRFVRLEGSVVVSTTDGIVQTFVERRTDPATGDVVRDVGATGTTADTHVANPVELSDDPQPDDPILLPVAENGWELYLLCCGLFVVLARRLQRRDDGVRRRDDGNP